MNDRPVFDLGPVVDGGALDIGVSSDEAYRARDSQPLRQRPRSPQDSRSLPIAVVLVLFAALGALVVLVLVTGGDDQAIEQDGAVPTEERDVEGEVDRSSTDRAVDSAASDTPVAGSFEPPSAPHLRADEVGLVFDERIDTTDRQYGIAYVANDDFIVLDHRGITLPELEIAVDFDTVSNLALLTNDGRTWAINPSDRDQSYLVSNSYVVVVSQRPSTIAVITPGDQPVIGLMSSALPVPSLQLPQDSELLWVQGRGALVMPRTGGTFELAGLASSLERISDDRALAASANGTVYETCDDRLVCTFVSQIDDGPSVELPFAGDVAFDISPDGAWVVASTETEATVFDVAEGVEVMTLELDGTTIDWAPDSSFVAIAARDGLSIVFPGTQEVLPMRLNQTPDNGSLLVFANDR